MVYLLYTWCWKQSSSTSFSQWYDLRTYLRQSSTLNVWRHKDCGAVFFSQFSFAAGHHFEFGGLNGASQKITNSTGARSSIWKPVQICLPPCGRSILIILPSRNFTADCASSIVSQYIACSLAPNHARSAFKALLEIPLEMNFLR